MGFLQQQGYSSSIGATARGYAAGSGRAEEPSNSAYPPAESYLGEGARAAPYSRRGKGYGTNYRAGTRSRAGYSGYLTTPITQLLARHGHLIRPRVKQCREEQGMEL